MNSPRPRYFPTNRRLGFESLEQRQLLAATPIEIFAAGDTGEETLELQIDGATVATFTNVGGDPGNRVFQQFSYVHPTDVTADQVRVAFNNNGVATGGGDINLHVDRIEVNGTSFETEAPSVFSVGTAVFGVGCTSGFIQSETLWCDGYFQYSEPTGSVIEIQAAGWTGEETLDLEIDGNVVASFENVGGDAPNRVFETLSYTHTGSVSIDQIRVAFNNNGVTTGGGDRNLQVDKVILDGQEFETEAPSVFSVGTAVFGVGCTSGFIQSETLWCNGYFEYSQPTGSSIQIVAGGETGEERIDLSIDGNIVASFENVGGNPGNRVFQTFDYTHTTNVTIDQIRVEFNNNGISTGGGDMNLWVDKVVLDGTDFETEADDTYSVGSYLPGLGCTEGTLLTETLYCNGYFEYQTTSNPGTLQLGTTQVSVNEEDGTVSIPVERINGSDGAVTLNYTTVDATATSGEDYIITAGQAILGPGVTSTNIVVPIINDTDDEGNETFNVSTDQTTGGATLGFPRTATITILDDDGGPTIGNGNGLLGTYYNDRDLLDFEFDRTDATVDFDWGFGSPDSSIGSSTFSAVWSGQIEPLYSETYTFEVQVDDGLRLYVDNQLIIDEWQNQATTHTGQIALQGGIRHDIRIEYYENTGNAEISLRWSSASQALEVVPQTQLYSDPPFNLNGTFSGQTLISGLDRPTALDFAPDGRMFIAQQNGIVRVYENGSLLSQPFIDISARVNNVQDRGLLGLAVHPQFPAEPYVYLLYTYEDPNELAASGNAGPDGRGNRVARLERITADAATGFNTATSNTGTVILGTNSTWDNISFPDQDSTNNINLPASCAPDGTLQDCLPADSRSHTIGTVLFGNDGMLYVTNGDGTSFGQVDPRTVRVQDIDSLSGKVLRIDPLTGDGLADNPFWNGDADANRSKVYSYGLRNPFRMAIRPSDGEPYISDVGWNTYEEINTGRGQNFGWPFYEGGDGQNLQTGGYSNLPEAPAFYANNNAVPPLWSRSHADGGVAMVAGDFYSGGPYPSVLDDSLFFTDFGDPRIRALILNADGSFNRQIVIDNSVGATVEMTMGLDGLMYYVDLNGNVGRFIFNSNASLSATAPGVGAVVAALGDIDLDGDADGHDFLNWQRNFGNNHAAPAPSDLNTDDVVDHLDLHVWKTGYSSSTVGTTNDDLAALAAAFWMSGEEESTSATFVESSPIAADFPVDGASSQDQAIAILAAENEVEFAFADAQGASDTDALFDALDDGELVPLLAV